ncbi:hypothetical protein ACWGQ2_12475 [Arthrobacter sp. NPDC055585]
MTNGPESADAPRRSRRAAGSGSTAGAQERESQQRARDREALRAYKALTDSQPRPEPSDDANPPTRRQLRLAQQAAAQQAAAQAALRSAQQQEAPAASAESTGSAGAAEARPANAQRSGDMPSGRASGLANEAQQDVPQPASRRERRRAAAAAAAPPPAAAPGTPAAHAHVKTEPAKPEAAKPAAVKPAAAKAEPAKPAAAKTESKPPEGKAESKPAAKPGPTAAPVVQPVTPAPDRAPAVQEKSARKQPSQVPAGNENPRAKAAAAAEPNADVANMSVEQALAAREALKHQARNQVAAMEALQQSDPHAVDLELLAQQRALAERAAVLNRRTANIQRLAQENEQRRSAPSDPTTAHNLAMVTPLEFVEMPGLDRPVMKPPPTSHVPVVTSPKTAARKAPSAGRAPGTPKSGSDRRPPRAGETAPAAAAEVRHSKILARADALVNAPLEADQGAKPVGARSAFGLDPLDVMTAGLGRTRRIRFVSLGIVGVGLIALTLGVLMIVGGLGS